MHTYSISFWKSFIFLIFGLIIHFPSNAFAIEADEKSAIILAYHRIGEDYQPDESLRIGAFREHVEELINGSYHITPLPEIIAALENEKELPPNTVVITFDGGYRSILDEAVPLLLEKNMPFTVFYANDKTKSASDEFLTWNDLKELKNHKGVTLGVLPSAYSRISGLGAKDLMEQLNITKAAHRSAFNEEPSLFSYPYGETSALFKKLVTEHGYKAAFGLQSGVAHAESDRFMLPRFSVTEQYGDIDHFRTILKTLPFPVSNLEPEYPLLESTNPVIGFTVGEELQKNLLSLSCFASGQNEAQTQKIGDGRIEIRLKYPITETRTRINCTLPEQIKSENGDDETLWRWLGILLIRQ